ncbi:hypothetical protein Q7P36_008545 [Cladosporium allicinum]
MAFRKRNIGIGRQPASPASPTTPEAPTPIDQLPGVRPSPLTSHPVTSTGAPSIDGLLGGHSGLALGSSLLIGEHDTTDFAGALLRYYAAEGILQGHVVHVVGVGEGWTRELPGLADARYLRKQEQEKLADTDKAAQDRMKIAWSSPRSILNDKHIIPRTPRPTLDTLQPHLRPNKTPPPSPPNAKINHIPLSRSTASPFQNILATLQTALQTTPPTTIHRLVIPTILSPALYPPHRQSTSTLPDFPPRPPRPAARPPNPPNSNNHPSP